MGIYHNISNETKKEFIDPGKVGGGSIKYGFVFNCGSLVLWLMANAWQNDNVQVNKDTSDHKYKVEEKYKDITLDAIKAFNKVWPDHKIEICKD